MTAPLVLLSELKRHHNLALGDEDADEARLLAIQNADLRLRELIVSAGQFLTTDRMLANGRRFDRRVETRYYTPLLVEHRGDLLGARTLLLGDDLVEVIELLNGDGVAVTDYTLLPRSAAEKPKVRLGSSALWTYDDDPVEAVALAGVWGWGGGWLSTGDAVQDDPLSAGAAMVSVSDYANFEVGMMLAIEDEYVLVTDVTEVEEDDDTLAVTRSYNGSTAAEHANGSALSYFQAGASIREQVRRLVAWRLEQAKAPLFGQAVIGEFAIPVKVDGAPNDVVAAMQSVRRKRPVPFMGG